MQKRSGRIGKARLRSIDGVRWLLAPIVTLVLALAVGTSKASAAETLDCSAVMHRECTYLEETAFCVINAYLVLRQCEDEGGFFNDVECWLEYSAEYWMCWAEIPLVLTVR